MLIPPIAAPPPSTAPPVKSARFLADPVSATSQPFDDGSATGARPDYNAPSDQMTSDQDRSASNAPTSVQTATLASSSSVIEGGSKAAEQIAMWTVAPTHMPPSAPGLKTESISALLSSASTQTVAPRTVLTDAVEAYTALQGYKGEPAQRTESV